MEVVTSRFPETVYQFYIFKPKKDDRSGIRCETAHSHPLKEIACRTKISQKQFDAILTTGKSMPKTKNIINLGVNVFELDKNRTCLPVFSPLDNSRKVP